MARTSNEVDVIIAGGGTAGCIVASRLAKADPQSHFLLIEQGADQQHNPNTYRLGMWKENLTPNSDTVHFYQAKPNARLNGRSIDVPLGRGLGGCSLIQNGLYTRPVPADFTEWDTEGWSYDDMAPYFKRAERSHDLNSSASPEFFGDDGRMPISMAGVPFSSWHAEFNNIVAKSQGWEAGNDFSKSENIGYVAPIPKPVHPATGHRYSTFTAYLRDSFPPNLSILTDTTTVRVMIEDGRAVGVDCLPSDRSNDQPSNATPSKHFARKLVVLSAGVWGSPQILERSGIGNPQILKSKGIKPTVDLPGVGENYQDHLRSFQQFLCDKDTPSNVYTATRNVEEMAAAVQEFERNGKGPLSSNFMDLAVRIRPSEDEVNSMRAGFQQWWRKISAGKPDLPLGVLVCGPACDWAAGELDPTENYFTIGGYIARPASRGSIHISSASPHTPPDYDARIMWEEVDLDAFMWLYKVQRNVARSHPHFRGEPESLHPPFSADSPARLLTRAEVENSIQLGTGIGPVTYTAVDDAVLAAWGRDTVGPAGSIGTCAMRPRESGGVVDPNLNVYGVDGLKICDLSIAPEHVSSNLTSLAMAVAERGVVKIGEYLGIDEGKFL